MNTAGLVGRRVRLVHCSDRYSNRAPGSEGIVRFIDSMGTVHVRWDDGGMLGLIPGEDVWEVLPGGEPFGCLVCDFATPDWDVLQAHHWTHDQGEWDQAVSS